jgi:hypothetical protein
VYEEDVNVKILLNLLAEGFKSEDRIWHRGMHELIREESNLPSLPIAELLDGTRSAILVEVDATGNIRACTDPIEKASDTIFPGSFDPLHPGHLEMMGIVGNLQSSAAGINYPSAKNLPDLEISIKNAAKPVIDLLTLEARLKAMGPVFAEWLNSMAYKPAPLRVWLTQAPTFKDKTEIFFDRTFVCGYDTAVRICDPKYAGPIEQLIPQFNMTKTKFFVFGRTIKGEYHVSDALPTEFLTVAAIIDTPRIHTGASSTELRAHAHDRESTAPGASPAPVGLENKSAKN